MIMRKKFLISSAVVLILIITALCATLICGCSDGDEKYPVWNLSPEVTAEFSDNGKYGFILTVKGNGEVPGYTSEKDAPWYGKSGRVTEIVISDGITSIGKNAFPECIAIKSVVLPASVTVVGENAFPAGTQYYAYSAVNVADGGKVYLYSENAPASAGDFWHYKNGIVAVWDTSAKTMKVLFIGNSFTFYSDIPSLFGKVAAGADKSVIVESVTQGSHTLEKFADASDEFGKKVDDKLKASDDYDAVVLQEHSTRPLTDYAKFLAGAKALQTKINATQKNCQIYLYATWGYKDGADARKITIPEMEGQLRTAYANAAREMGVKVCNVGAAFTKVYNEHPELNLYFKADNKHPSYTGAYLSACVHVATILGCDPRTSVFNGVPADDTDGVYTEDMAKLLKETAYAVAFGN